MASMDDMIGGFKCLNIIGSGAQGKVWKAKCVRDLYGIVPKGTIVALKVSYEHGVNAAQRWTRVQRRVHELKGLTHPNVVRYLGCFCEKGREHDRHVVVLEFLDGQTLKEYLEKSVLGLDVDESLRLAEMVLSGLEYVTSKKIAHRDIKPGNIFLCRDGSVKLIDFGVARQEYGTVTESGNIRGSWDYMAPDFIEPSFRGDQISDIFSLGVVLHQILIGQLPYSDLNKIGMGGYFSRWAERKKSSISALRINPMVSRLIKGIDNVFDRALAIDRTMRFATFSDFKISLRALSFYDIPHGEITYRRLKFVGRGSFGEVFKAKCLETGRIVAMKRLLNQEYAYRFRKEAAVLRQLDDPCFVKFLDFFETMEGSYLVMRFLEGMPGSSLKDTIRQFAENGKGGLSKQMVLLAFERYARGLAILHKKGIVHRDIKPSNLYYPADRMDHVAIMDFGIVRVEGSTFTSGIVPCTYDYAPPEIAITADRGSPGMDIYALGLCMYEALTGGRRPYPPLPTGTTGLLALFDRAKSMQAPDFSDPRVCSDGELLNLLRKMTAPDVSKRLSDALKLAIEIRRLFYRDVSEKEFPNRDPKNLIEEVSLRNWLRKKHAKEESCRIEPEFKSFWRRWFLLIAGVSMVSGACVALIWTLIGSQSKTPFQNGESSAVEKTENPVSDSTVANYDTTETVETNDSNIIEIKKLRRKNFKLEFETLLRDEPFGDRRKRISDARAMLTSEDAGLYSRQELEGFRRSIVKCEKLVVGELRNACGEELTADNRKISDGERVLFRFPEGNPEAHFMSLEGYKPRPFPKDIDGRSVVVQLKDFSLAPVNVSRPKLDDSVECYVDGKILLEDGLLLMPGHHECVYVRKGYEKQSIKFDINKGVRSMVIPSPERWSPSPVEVIFPPLPDEVICEIDGKAADQPYTLLPGEHVVEYKRKGYLNQKKFFLVNPAQSAVLPIIGDWIPLKAVVMKPTLERGVVCFIDGKPLNADMEVNPGVHKYEYRKKGCSPQFFEVNVESGDVVRLKRPEQWVLSAEVKSESTIGEKYRKEALDYYAYEEWRMALDRFGQAKSAGWMFSEEDMEMIGNAFTKQLAYLQNLIKYTEAEMSMGRDPKRDVNKLKQERRGLIDLYNSLKIK